MRDNDTLSPTILNQSESVILDSLRPQSFEGYVGQKAEVENIQVFVKAARLRNESLCHLLLCGPPGLGKTTLARICAHELGVNIMETSGPAIQKKGDLAGLLTALEERDVLFIDEIHRLNPVIEENLYPAMEDFSFDILIGSGPQARSIKMPLKKFTLIGATTRAGLLTSPLRDRFGHIARLDYYGEQELAQIVRQSATVLRIPIEEDAVLEIARRSRGTPRIANRMLLRIRDFATVQGKTSITRDLADESLLRLHDDKCGLDKMDHRILRAIIDLFNGGPVGIESLAATVSEQADTLEDVYEPYLLQQGFIQRTPRGRMATARAYQYFGLDPVGRTSDPYQHELF